MPTSKCLQERIYNWKKIKTNPLSISTRKHSFLILYNSHMEGIPILPILLLGFPMNKDKARQSIE